MKFEIASYNDRFASRTRRSGEDSNLKREHIMTETTIIETPTAPSAEEGQGDLLFRFNAQLNVLPIGIVPEGLRMANRYEGSVNEGAIPAGSTVWGIDHLLLRSDGVCVIDAQTTISLPDGTNIYEQVHGYCLPPEGMPVPPLEVLTQPGFEWPDVDFPIVGASTFRAADPRYAYLNRTTARIDGWANFKTGGLAVDTRAVQHDSTAPRP